MLSQFAHHWVESTEVANFQYFFILYKNVIRNQFLVDMTSLMNVIQSHCNLQNTVENPFGVEVLVFVGKESLRNPVSEVFSFQSFHKYQLFALGGLHLECLGDMDMVADVNPLFDLIFQKLLFVPAGNFLVGFVVKH